MRKYEILFLIPGDVPENTVQENTQKLTKLIRTHNGHVLKIDDWGKKKLAYPVQKQIRGHFIYILFLGEGNAISALERLMRLDPHIAKFNVSRLSDDLRPDQVDQEIQLVGVSDNAVSGKNEEAKPANKAGGPAEVRESGDLKVAVNDTVS